MSSDWQVVRLEDIASGQAAAMATGPFGSSISAKYFTSMGIPVIRGSNLSADVSIRLNDDKIVFVSPEKALEFRRSVARRGDLVFTCWGTINQVGLIDETATYDEYIVSNKQMKVTLDTIKADPRFIYYVFSGPDKQTEILENGIGSSVPGFNLGQLRSHKIALPSKIEQCAISDFLKHFDSRIDIFRQTNTTLEAIAQALFKSWFVDFDPVRAKAEGREPEGMDAATAALFPSELEESELGIIPKGWLAGTFGSVAQQSKGGVNPLKFPETLYDHYSLPAFDAELMPVRELGEAIKSNKTPVPKDAVLISKLNPHIPRVWFTGDVRPNAVCSTEFLVWTSADGVPAEYIYCLATSTVFSTAMKQLVTGTSNSHQRVKPDYLTAINAVIPSPELTAAFGIHVRPLLRRVLENRSIAQSLAQLRDTLLPRLISGKLRLPEAEILIEEAVA